MSKNQDQMNKDQDQLSKDQYQMSKDQDQLSKDQESLSFAKTLISNIKQYNFDIFQHSILNEGILNQFCLLVNKDNDLCNNFITIILNYITNNQINKNFDWNVGSILQHFSGQKVLAVLKTIQTERLSFLYDMIGINWVLGVFNCKDVFIINFLHNTVKFSRNSEAWWRAAFSLEKITGENAINFLKRSIKSENTSINLDYCLKKINDKKNVIRILLEANNTVTKTTIFPYLKKKFLSLINKQIKDPNELVNIVWLLGRLHLLSKKLINLLEKKINCEDNYEAKYYLLWAIQENG